MSFAPANLAGGRRAGSTIRWAKALRIGGRILWCLAMLPAAHEVSAGETGGRLFGPPARKAHTDFRAEHTGARGIGSRPGKDATTLHVTHALPCGSGEIWTGFSAGRLRLERGVILPANQVEIGGKDWWQARWSVGGRRALESGNLAGGLVSAGCASDQPFESASDLSWTAMGFYHRPVDARSGWLFMMHYGNRRTFLPGVPLPGVGYWYAPSADTRIILGAPFFSARLRRGPALLHANLFGPVAGFLDLEWDAGYPCRPFLRTALQEQSWRRSERERSKDDVVLREVTLSTGLRRALGRFLRLEAAAGYATERAVYEGRGYSKRHANRTGIGDALFVHASLTLSGTRAGYAHAPR